MSRLLFILLWFFFIAVPASGGALSCGFGSAPCASAPVEGFVLFNSQTTGAANTAVAVTIPAVLDVRAHIYEISARCSAGTSSLTVTDGGVTIWSTAAAEVGTATARYRFDVGLSGTRGSQVIITLASCGVGNTGTLIVQADRF